MERQLYGFTYSSCTHRVRLLLSMLDLPYTEIQINLAKGEQRQPRFLSLNPVGQVPVLIDEGRKIFDSHAIMLYLADRYGRDEWWQEDPYERALVSQWLFFDANEIHNGVGAARNHLSFRVPGDSAAASVRGCSALSTLDVHLADRQWLELNKPTIADVACCTLVAVAAEGNLDLGAFNNVRSWLARVQQLPGFVTVPTLPRPA